MKAFYLLFILLITSAVTTDCYAQTFNDNLKEAERQRALTNEQNKERDRQNLENNRPVEKEKTSTSDINSNQSYTDMAKSIIGYKEPELTEAEKAAKEKYIQEYNEQKRLENVRMTPEQIRQADAAVAQYYTDRANEERILKPFIDQLINAGYSKDDAQQVMKRYKSDLLASTFYSKSRDKEFEQEIIVFQKVKDNDKKVSFETLSQDAVNLISARSYTSSLDYLTLLEKQFSEKKADVDLLRKEVFKSYFWHEASYGDMSNTAKKKLIEDYFVFEEANPTFYNELHNFLKGKLGTSPYKIVKFHYEDKLDCTICSYSGKEKKEFKDTIEKYKSREEAVIKNTFKGYYREGSTKGKISYFNSDKVEVSMEEFMIHQVETDKEFKVTFEPNVTPDLIKKLAVIKKIEPAAFINDFLRIEPKDKFELLLKMAENNDYQAMRSAYLQEKDERYKDISASYHLKDKWFDYFASRAVQGNVDALKLLYESYNDYHQRQYNNKNTTHPKQFEVTFNAFVNKATDSQVFDFSEPLAVEYYKSNVLSTNVSDSYIPKMRKVCVNAIYKLAENGNIKAIELTKKWSKIEAERKAKEEAEKADCTKSIYYSSQKQDGCGTERFSNGDLYQGPFKNGYYNGVGKFEKYNRWVYEGDFVNGQKHGKGTLRYQNGNVYEGDFVKEQQTFGKLTYADGRVYEGQFLNGLKNGKGNFKYKSGATYTGDFVNDLLHGKGKFMYASGDVYEGDFVHNEFEGKGTYTYSNGNVYEGDFKKGKFHGKGKLIKKSGYYASGNFENNTTISLNYFNPSKVEITKEEYDKN